MHGCEEFCPFGGIGWDHLADVGSGLFVAMLIMILLSLCFSLVLVEVFGGFCEDGKGPFPA